MTKDQWFFYRIENEYGEGPYVYGKWRKWGLKPQDLRHGRPSPLLDECENHLRSAVTKNHGLAKFGFVTLNQLQSWFYVEEIKKLERMGFRIKRVLGRTLAESEHQVVFIPIS